MIQDTTANKAINTNKRQDIVANKKLNATADKTIDSYKKQDIITELSMLIKNQIIRQIKLKVWIKIG